VRGVSGTRCSRARHGRPERGARRKENFREDLRDTVCPEALPSAGDKGFVRSGAGGRLESGSDLQEGAAASVRVSGSSGDSGQEPAGGGRTTDIRK